MSSVRPNRPNTPDCAANYNAFGRDPDGFITWIAAFLYGPSWVPPTPAQQFVGLPLPPRYGPPAAYQLSSLPEGFKPRPPPQFHSFDPTSIDAGDYLKPPKTWDPKIFSALRCTVTFEDKALKRCFDRERRKMKKIKHTSRSPEEVLEFGQELDGYETEPVTDSEERGSLIWPSS